MTSKQGYTAIKLDMEKAYDRLDWQFIKKCFTNLGFSENGKLDYGILYYNEFLCSYKWLPRDPFRPGRGITKGTLYPPTFSLFVRNIWGDFYSTERITRNQGLALEWQNIVFLYHT